MVALKLRVGGPKTPCNWPYHAGICKSLSTEDFELLKAYCIQDKSIDEISTETGYSPTRIRVRIHRIRKKVKHLIT
ncbi:MAG: hypothetical protein IJH25_02740, partial [Clostridia bacterium]|nr:hypothetical protein [Clostridia bacterium]